MEYICSAASHASCPDGVPLLPESTGRIGFRFVPLETPMLVVAVTAHVQPRHVGGEGVEYARMS
jgi:hypothetical protein